LTYTVVHIINCLHTKLKTDVRPAGSAIQSEFYRVC